MTDKDKIQGIVTVDNTGHAQESKGFERRPNTPYFLQMRRVMELSGDSIDSFVVVYPLGGILGAKQNDLYQLFEKV